MYNRITILFLIMELTKEKKQKRVKAPPLSPFYSEDSPLYEIGVDEVGRGPMFGRVYTAAVCLPKDSQLFDHSLMKDSKKFSGKHKEKHLSDMSDYIKEHALSWSISYEDETMIDQINILQATQQSMHKSISEAVKSLDNADYSKVMLLIDGNYFKPMVIYNSTKNKMEHPPVVCIEGGENKYASIAAASILAKVARDQYIADLCLEHPWLQDRYNLESNKGYGSKAHMAGIMEHGITQWHRKTFGICKQYSV